MQSLHKDFVAAAWAIIIAGIFDFMDGRIARLTHAESEFGVEYDSLVDLASFGLAPGILIYTWALSGFGRLGWLIAFLYFACGALRLARFNVQIDNVEKKHFQGLPIPTAAYMVALLTVLYKYVYGYVPVEKSYVALFATFFVAALMVSNVRYFSFKQINFKTRWSFFALVLIVVFFFIIASEPVITLFVLCCCYILSGIIDGILTLKKGKELWERVKGYRELRNALQAEDTSDNETIYDEPLDNHKKKDETGPTPTH